MTSDQGVAEVARILAHAGWACESVGKDYGEDLICQTRNGQVVDAHRILVQIKSTRSKPKSVSIRKGTLLKWLTDPNLIILCIWSSSDETVLYAIPENLFRVHEVEIANKKTISINLDQAKVLDSAAAAKIAWEARLRNLNRRFLEAKNRLENSDCDPDADNIAFPASQRNLSDLGAVLCQFLELIGLAEPDGEGFRPITRVFAEEMTWFGYVAKDRPEFPDFNLKFESMVLLTVLMRANRLVPCGLPIALVEAASRALSNCLCQIVESAGSDPSGSNSPAYSEPKEQLEDLAIQLWRVGSQLSETEIAQLKAAVPATRSRQ